MPELKPKLLSDSELSEIRKRADRDLSYAYRGWTNTAMKDRMALLAHLDAMEKDLRRTAIAELCAFVGLLQEANEPALALLCVALLNRALGLYEGNAEPKQMDDACLSEWMDVARSVEYKPDAAVIVPIEEGRKTHKATAST